MDDNSILYMHAVPSVAVLVERIRNHLLAFGQNRSLLRDLRQSTNYAPVAVDKPVQCIRDTNLITKVLDKLLRAAEVVPRHAGVKVVNGLELQATMEEIEPGGALDIHRGAKHLLGKRFVRSHIRCTHGEVRKADLGMKRHGDRMADHNKNKPVPGSRNGLV